MGRNPNPLRMRSLHRRAHSRTLKTKDATILDTPTITATLPVVAPEKSKVKVEDLVAEHLEELAGDAAGVNTWLTDKLVHERPLLLWRAGSRACVAFARV